MHPGQKPRATISPMVKRHMKMRFAGWPMVTCFYMLTGLSMCALCFNSFYKHAMCGSRNFRKWFHLSSKSSDTTFLLLLYLFYRSPYGLLKKTIIFQGSGSRWVYHFPRGRGSNFFNGVQLLIPHRNPYNLVIFQGVRNPFVPLDPCMYTMYPSVNKTKKLCHDSLPQRHCTV